MAMSIPQKLKNGIKTLIPNRYMMHRLPRNAGDSVVLTFDDGPDPLLTPKILKQLKKYDVRAVFFVVGKKIEKAPFAFDMIVEHGHVIGNHTFNHPNYIITSKREYRNELIKCEEMIKNKCGEGPHLIRPPLGMSFANLQVSKSMGKKIILWSIEAGEWGVHKYDSTKEITMRLKNNLKLRDILLLHDNNHRTIEILDTILPFLKYKNIDITKGINYLIP